MCAAPDALAPGGNRLLVALPPEDYQALRPRLAMVALAARQQLHEPGTHIDYVYFPVDGVLSLVTTMQDGVAVEIATVGNEGMVGLPVFLGVGASPVRTFCQVPGHAQRMEAEAFRAAVTAHPSLHDLLHRYTQAVINQIAQSAACNRIHSIEQRCARWLLMTHDRVMVDQFPLTHEFLAQMLGVRRATVTETAGRLQQAGLITYRQREMTIRDRAGLEAAACECYGAIREEYQRLLGIPRG